MEGAGQGLRWEPLLGEGSLGAPRCADTQPWELLLHLPWVCRPSWPPHLFRQGGKKMNRRKGEKGRSLSAHLGPPASLEEPLKI